MSADRDPSATAARTPGARRSGGERRMVPPAKTHSYYDQPILKEPVWTWEIPTYFFTGGLAGASAGLGFAARLAGNERLARGAWGAALAGVVASPALLISDLGRPGRFFNMLRVFKPTSPMSMGSWILAASGAATTGAAADIFLGLVPKPLGRVAGASAALLGLPLSTYTAALISDTSIPVWHEARRELPFVFGGGAMASAGAVASIVTPVDDAGPARRLALLGALLEVGAAQAMEQRLGQLAGPYHEGAPAWLSRAAKLLTVAGGLTTAMGGRRSRRLATGGAGALLAGSLLERWAVFRAGFASARDPRQTVDPQRERRQQRGAPG